MGLVDFVEALEVLLVRLGEGNNQQGCSDAHPVTGIPAATRVRGALT